MAGNDWDAELKKIDKQLESLSDDELLSAGEAKTPAQREKRQVEQSPTTIGKCHCPRPSQSRAYFSHLSEMD